METIRVVFDAKLLRAVDRAAKRTRRTRSALIRDALREHLLKLEMRVLDERDREGYSKHPQVQNGALLWEREAAWPAE